MNQENRAPIQVSDQDFADQVLQADGPVLVDFWAEWCGPCRALGPIIESLSAEYGDRARIVKIDVDANQRTAQQYAIRSIPTVILFDKGEIVHTFVGVRPRGDYAASLDAQLAAHA